jgi:phosphatidate cytidylyltransferase
MLIKRLLTALVLIPLVVSAIFWLPSHYFSMLTGAFILVGAWEWAGLSGLSRQIFRWVYVACMAFAILIFSVLPANTTTLAILSAASVIWVWAFFAITQYQRGGSGLGFQLSFFRLLVGFVLLIATWFAIMTLKSFPQLGSAWLMVVLVLIWCADIGAYFAGRFFGKKLLCSRVSPKKTWEGFVGGMILSVLAAAIGGLFLSLSISHYVGLLLLACVAALFSVVGDLFESLLKRIAGVKDSGAFFPGHGGMLDRLDSIMSATVIFVLGALLLGL